MDGRTAGWRAVGRRAGARPVGAGAAFLRRLSPARERREAPPPPLCGERGMGALRLRGAASGGGGRGAAPGASAGSPGEGTGVRGEGRASARGQRK